MIITKEVLEKIDGYNCGDHLKRKDCGSICEITGIRFTNDSIFIEIFDSGFLMPIDVLIDNIEKEYERIE